MNIIFPKVDTGNAFNENKLIDTFPYAESERPIDRWTYDTNPLSNKGLELASQIAMQRINNHIDMRVREWESKQEIKQVFKRFDEAGIMLYNPLANQPRAIDQRTAMQNIHPTIDHDKLRALQNTRRFVNP